MDNMRERDYVAGCELQDVYAVYLPTWNAMAPSLESANLLISRHAGDIPAGEYKEIEIRLLYKDKSFCRIKCYINAHDSKSFSIAHTLQGHAHYCVHPSLN